MVSSELINQINTHELVVNLFRNPLLWDRDWLQCGGCIISAPIIAQLPGKGDNRPQKGQSGQGGKTGK